MTHWISVVILGGILSGCSDVDPPEVAQEYPIEAEVAAAFQAHSREAGVDDSLPIQWNIDSPIETRPAAARSGSVRTELAHFSQSLERPVKLSFGGFMDAKYRPAKKDSVSDPVLLVQAPALPAVPAGFDQDDESGDGNPGDAGPSASDLGRVEIVPTPPARPEVKAELIPTPQGIPERSAAGGDRKTNPVARIATEIGESKSLLADPKPSSMEATAARETTPGKPALIDPSMDLGLVGATDGPEDFKQWPIPDAVLFVTGDQHGYIEPCGCTGLDKQKGGVARRYTFINQLREMGWPLIPVDAGNQIRGIRKQAAIKFEKSTEALKQMKYEAVGFGPGDMRLSSGDLIAYTLAQTPEDAMYVSGNMVLFDPSFLPTYKVVKKAEWNVGITSILDPDALESPVDSEITIQPIKDAAARVLKEMNAAGANFRVLTFFGEESVAKQLMVDVPGYDLIVVSGGYGEPTYKPQSIDGSTTKMILTGNKGMYVGLVGLYQNQPMKYVRVPLTHEYKDAPEMRKLMADYQLQLEQLGLGGLGLSPSPHLSGQKFVGTQACGKCHKTALNVWETSDHAKATEHLVTPTEGRGDVPRHFDPECLSCHVTGWNPQDYLPYESGYLDLKQSAHLLGNGCENCHGPGSAHAAAEEPNSGIADDKKLSLRKSMQLSLERAKEKCMSCHDLDNSPDFHDEDAFEDVYWPQVEHYGVD
ncbi:MAG: hypothetical protein KDB00_22465 [Planctomycetales bacterium]|nr:hypothetical protein [Planctomycetales bacterium]